VQYVAVHAGLHAQFKDIVLHGLLAPAGMERFDDMLSEKEVDDIHAYLIDQSREAYRVQKRPYIYESFTSLLRMGLSSRPRASSGTALLTHTQRTPILNLHIHKAVRCRVGNSNEDRWERIKDLLHEAMQLNPEQRARFLDEVCPSGDACRVEVDSLLRADADAPASFLRWPSTDSPEIGDVIDLPGDLKPGLLFEGRFQLVSTLGEGGMGQVWLANQIAPVRRQVALKLIKAGMYDPSVVQRFRSERQSLAMMDHPAIAKVFEAGATDQGQPYFVMEYVHGLPITKYCDEHRLDIAARLELFIQACEGVQHAHQKGIAHRDLKPANILVVDIDAAPVPRIIDFGLAKTTTPEPRTDSELTLLGQFIGTPGYMSPEQADPDLDIDSRTDVYSLGVVLYVLLTGHQPFDVGIGKRPPLDVLLRKLREEDPPPPSAKAGMDRDTVVSTALDRGLKPKQLIQRLRGDLDWIAMKALERDRTRRYGTPSEFAADLRRHLQHEAVTARPASVAYRFQKYVRRHRLAVGVAAGSLAVLTAFSALQAVELRRTTMERDRANQERDRANRERDRAARITDFMTAMFQVPDPSEARGNSVTAREILDKASNDIGTQLAQDAEVQSQMQQVMAETYLNLGLYDRAHDLSKRALDTRQRVFGPRDANTLATMGQLGWILDRQGHLAEAADIERQAFLGETGVASPDAPSTLEIMDHLTVIDVDQGHYEDAEKRARLVAYRAIATLGADDTRTLHYRDHLALALWYLGRYADSEQQCRDLLEIERRVLGSDHPQTLATLNGLASAVAMQHRISEAERLYQAVIAAQTHVLGPEHRYTVLNLENLASLLVDSGHAVEAEKIYRRVLDIRQRTLGAEHPESLNSKVNLAYALFKEGRILQSDEMTRQTLPVQQRVLGREDPSTLVSQANLAAILIREHRYAEAEKLASDTLSVQTRTLGAEYPQTLDTLRIYGRALAFRRRYAEASHLFQEAIDRLNKGADRGVLASVWYSYACVAAAAGRLEEALGYLREAVQRGYQDAEGLTADDDLRALRHNAQFLELVAGIEASTHAAPSRL
jgi:tetratricopeptide (TPR) repeat protein